MAFHVIAQCYRSRQRARSQQIMPAAMPVATSYHWLPLGQSRLLAQSTERIELAQESDDRLAAAIAADKGRLDASHTTLNRKSLALQSLTEQRGRAKLFKSGLRVPPDRIAQRNKL